MLAPHCGFPSPQHPSHLVYIYPANTLDLTIIHQPSHPSLPRPSPWTPSTTLTALYINHTQSPLAHQYYSAQVLTTKSSTTATLKTSSPCSTPVNHPCTDPCNPSCLLNMNPTLDNAHQPGLSHILTNQSSWPTTSTSSAPAHLFFLPSSKQP